MPTLSASATLSAIFGHVLAVIALGAGVEAHRSKRLVGVLAGRNGLGVANGDLAVQIRDVGDGLDLDIGALSANDHEVVDEHVLTRVGVDELGGLGVVHGALGGRDEHVDGGTGAHLLDKVARRLKLRVGEGGAGLVGVKLLNLGQSLLERVGGKDLQLDGFLLGRCLSRTGIGSRPARTSCCPNSRQDQGRQRRQQKARQNRGEKPYRTYSTLSDVLPGHPTAGFILLLDYTSSRIMFVIMISRLINFFYR